MGCYQCGGAEGNEMKLCPACTKVRVEKRKADREAEARPRNLEHAVDPEAEERQYKMRMYAQAGGSAVFIGIMAWLFLFSVYGPGWGLSYAEHAYKKCIHKFGGALESKIQEQDTSNLSDAQKKFLGVGEAMMRGMGEAVCEGIRDKCKSDPKGEACRAITQAL